MGMYDRPPYYISAYGLAVKHGFVGTEAEWLASIKGESAWAQAAAGGYEGTEEEFIQLLNDMAEYIERGAAAIEDGSITTAKLATACVIAAKLASGCVTSEKLAALAVTTAALAAKCVTTAKLADSAVEADQISNGAVTRDKLAEGAVNTEKLATSSVTSAKLASGAVSAAYTGTLAAADWTGSAAPYAQALTVPGLLATDAPLVDVVMSGAWATDEARDEAWGGVYRAEASADTLTVYAAEKPAVDLPIRILCVRK